MQLVRSRTAHVLAAENITAQLSGSALDEMGYLPEVTLAIKANLAIIGAIGMQIDGLEKYLHERMTEPAGIYAANHRTRYRQDPGLHDPSRNWPDRTLCWRWQLRLLCSLRGQRGQRAQKQF